MSTNTTTTSSSRAGAAHEPDPAEWRDALTPAESADFGDRFAEAVDLVRRDGRVSMWSLQCHLGIGYCRAARMADAMERLGIVPPPIHPRPRATSMPVPA